MISGFKGLLPKTALAGDAIEPIVKKAEESKRSCQICIEFFGQIVKFQQGRSANNSKIVAEGLEPHEFKTSLNVRLWNILSAIVKHYKDLSGTTANTNEMIAAMAGEVFAAMSTEITTLEENITGYKEEEEMVLEMSKRYFKLHKSMLAAIQNYKSSFTEVNLIYNSEERMKRYQLCEQLYKSATFEYKAIGDRCAELMNKKSNIRKIYGAMEEDSRQVIKKIGSSFINKAKQFMESFEAAASKVKSVLLEFKIVTEDHTLECIFNEKAQAVQISCFNWPQNSKIVWQFTPFLDHHTQLKEQNLQSYNSQIQTYLKLLLERLQGRKNQNKKMFDNIVIYFKNVQKIQTVNAKQILLNFEKKRKKISEVFGNRFVSFLKSISSVFEISTGINDKLLKLVNNNMQSLQKVLSQQAKLVKLFTDEVNENMDKFTIKKQSSKNIKFVIREEEKVQASKQIRRDISKKADFLKHLLQGFREKMQKYNTKLVNNYEQIMSNVCNASVQFHSFCNEYMELYFGEKEFDTNISKFELDIDTTLQKYHEFYSEIPISSVKTDTSPITFDGEYAKIEDFKKLKKPVIGESTEQQKSGLEKVEGEEQGLKTVERNNSETNELTSDKQELKNAQFLSTKIIFKQGEKLIKTISCALSEKIVLQGKLYLTTERICFHSNFNSQNIFFGKTFIQFPKGDIKKIQKKKSSILIDNAISFTTVNGEIFFTSIFSRNEVYDLICRTFSFNLDDHVYEYVEKEDEELPQFLIDYEEKDDIKIADLEQRRAKINEIIQKFDYVESARAEISSQGLNAFKIFKIFFSLNQVCISNRRYDNFLVYIRSIMNQTGLQVEQWTPSLQTVLNQSNIKESSPLNLTRKLRAIVPMGNTGIPFMPKTAKSQQSQNLYFYSKHKFVLKSSVMTSGAPYTDTFKVEFKIDVESTQEGKCAVVLSYFVNFVKNTMMKSVIESKSREETVALSNIWVSQIKKYITWLSNKPKKSSESKQQADQQMEELFRQLDELKQENNKLKQQVSLKQKYANKLEYAAIALLVLTISMIILNFL